jgi:hypothetical protein
MLESDLQIAIANGFPQLTVVIHSLANLFGDSIAELAALGGGLQQYAQYHGLVISLIGRATTRSRASCRQTMRRCPTAFRRARQAARSAATSTVRFKHSGH